MYDYSTLPEHMQEPMKRYLEQERQPGGFLLACLSNNLCQAFAQADHINQHRLKDIVQFLYWEAPSPSWGNPDKVKAWMEQFHEHPTEQL